MSLHVHERIDTHTIIEAVRKKRDTAEQGSLFSTPEENPPLRQAIEFYRHNWINGLIAGDSLLVMSSLIEKEGLAGQVQMIYLAPPSGIRYGSNFQPFVNRRAVKDGRDEDLTQEPEMIRAFRGTWKLGIHSYLSYLRDRLFLARELLHESGSCFVQIGDENLHHVHELLDEIFGGENFFALITSKKRSRSDFTGLAGISDYLLCYAKDKKRVKFNKLFRPKPIGYNTGYLWIELPDGSRRRMTPEERRNANLLPQKARQFFTSSLSSVGYTPTCMYDFEFQGREFKCGSKSWRTHRQGMEQLIRADRIMAPGRLPTFVQFHDDFPVQPIHNLWDDTHGATELRYAVQMSVKVIQRCLLMATDPGDLVFDPTSGSGTTAYVAEQWGRRWITCDTSRVAVTLAKQRLMAANFDYYELAREDEGVGSGFRYETVPHVTLGSIANNPDIGAGMTREKINRAIACHAPQEILYDQPQLDRSKARVTGPFTVEAVPAPTVLPLDEVAEQEGLPADDSVARTGPTIRQGDWRDELLKTGIRCKSGQRIAFVQLEPLPGQRILHAEGETRPDEAGSPSAQDAALGARAVVSFGPDHAPMEQRQVEQAIEEAWRLVPRPAVVVFAAFQFDPEASKDIDETSWPGVTLLKAQMNADLLTDDLKKKRASNESFWLVGQPDVALERVSEGKDEGQFRVSVRGFDYYNTKTGSVESCNADKIALRMLDPGYDGRSLFPRQVFFPMAGAKDGWAKLAKSLKAEIDGTRMAAYRGTVSLPYEPGEHRRAAVKIVDDRGVESLKIVELS